MKKFLNSIYFYPFIAIVTIFIGLFGFYFYAVDEAKETLTKQQLQDKKEGTLFFKSIIEELSMGKKRVLYKERALALHRIGTPVMYYY